MFILKTQNFQTQSKPAESRLRCGIKHRQIFQALKCPANHSKTHQVFGNINNVQFPNLDCTLGVIQLVRDPRDVALSYAAHYGRDMDTAIEKLFDEKNSINEQSQPGSFEFISSWELNFLSWQDAAFLSDNSI